MFKAIYYQFYRCYKGTGLEPQPLLTSTWVLGISQGFMLNGIISWTLAKLYCFSFNMTLVITIAVCVLGLNYYYFHVRGVGKKILKEKPLLFSDKTISVIVSIVFFLFCISFIFWMPAQIKAIIDNC